MKRSLTLPTITVLVLAGTGLGIHLGEASIAEINPAYFSERPSRFHADLSPYQSQGDDGLRAAGGASMNSLGSECVGCRTYPEEYHPVHDPAVDHYLSSDSDAQEPVSFAEQQPGQEPREGDQDKARVELYASFPVSSDEAAARASAEVEYAPADHGGEPALD